MQFVGNTSLTIIFSSIMWAISITEGRVPDMEDLANYDLADYPNFKDASVLSLQRSIVIKRVKMQPKEGDSSKSTERINSLVGAPSLSQTSETTLGLQRSFKVSKTEIPVDDIENDEQSVKSLSLKQKKQRSFRISKARAPVVDIENGVELAKAPVLMQTNATRFGRQH